MFVTHLKYISEIFAIYCIAFLLLLPFSLQTIYQMRQGAVILETYKKQEELKICCERVKDNT